jgi:hypothetical protein
VVDTHAPPLQIVDVDMGHNMSCGKGTPTFGFGTVKPRPRLSLNDLQGWNISHSTRMCLKRSKALDKVQYSMISQGALFE